MVNVRTLIKKYLPTPAKIKGLQAFRWLGAWIHNPVLWKIDKHSISKAAAIGLFCAYVPVPFEMLLAALLAWLCRAYLPLSVMLVWLSNPFTWLLIYTPPYLLGCALLGKTSIALNEIAVHSMLDQLAALWVGCLIFGVSLGGAGYILSRVIWRMLAIRQWQNRHSR